MSRAERDSLIENYVQERPQEKLAVFLYLELSAYRRFLHCIMLDCADSDRNEDAPSEQMKK